MARQRDPYGDPVKLQMRHKWLRIRYYPTGLVTDPADRVWYDDKWDPNDPAQVAEAGRGAERIRSELYRHRAAAGIEHETTRELTVTVAMSVEKYLESKPKGTPTGTLKTHKSRLKILLLDEYGSGPTGNARSADRRTADRACRAGLGRSAPPSGPAHVAAQRPVPARDQGAQSWLSLLLLSLPLVPPHCFARPLGGPRLP
jgi:hypothetical protein